VALDFARAAFAVTEYRKTPIRVDNTVKTKDPLAVELEFTSLLNSESDAVAFGEYILDLRRVGRYDWTLQVAKNSISSEIGDTITLTYDRFGLQAGKNFIVKGVKKSQAALFDEYTLFGPQQ
jgi:hypothetical protein